jgi:hypothetical protein
LGLATAQHEWRRAELSPPAAASLRLRQRLDGASGDELGGFGRFGECGGVGRRMPPRPPVLAMLAVLACARAHHASAELIGAEC